MILMPRVRIKAELILVYHGIVFCLKLFQVMQIAVIPFGEQVSHRQGASAVRSISLTDCLHKLNILLLGACKNIQKQSFSIKILPVLGFNSHRPSFLKYKFISSDFLLVVDFASTSIHSIKNSRHFYAKPIDCFVRICYNQNIKFQNKNRTFAIVRNIGSVSWKCHNSSQNTVFSDDQRTLLLYHLRSLNTEIRYYERFI